MNEIKFERDILNAIYEILPFDVENVIEIDESLGTVYIDIDGGKTYYLTINKCKE